MTSPTNVQPTLIYLARHGESEWNDSQRISGQGDPALSSVGVGQAAALAQVLTSASLTAIYASTLQRTIATAQPTAAAHRLPIQSLAELQEISLGVLEGRYRDERDPAAQQLWQQWQQSKETLRIPGGEAFPEFAERVLRCWQRIAQTNAGGVLLLVGHRSTNRVLLGAIMRWPREQYLALPIRNKYLYEIRLNATQPGAQPSIATIRLDAEKIGHRYAEFRI